MRCPFCGELESQVKDSRPSEDGAAIRRRRMCPSCGGRFTTFERVQLRELTIVKRSGRRTPFEREKLMRSIGIALRKRPVDPDRVEKMVSGIRKALVNRPVTDDQFAALVSRIEGRLRRKGPEITSQQIGLEVLANLQRLDQVAYVRFASVYKDFQEIGDFQREVGLMLQKKESKARSR